MTQLWTLAVDDGAIQGVVETWLPFHAKSFIQPCFSGVGRCYEGYLAHPKSRLINAFPIVPNGKEFIESFNRLFKNMRINLIYEGAPLEMPEEFPYFASGGARVSTLPIALDITFSEEYKRVVQWYMLIPLLQVVRGFSPRYSFYKAYAENPLVESVFMKSVELTDGGMYKDVPYGLWSAVKTDMKTLCFLDSPEVMNQFEAQFSKLAYLPYGSNICRELNVYHSKLKGEEVEEEELEEPRFDDEEDEEDEEHDYDYDQFD